MIKICNKCKQEKDISMFNKNRTRKDGFDTWCKGCSNEYNKRYYIQNREKKIRNSQVSYQKLLTDPIRLFKKRATRYSDKVEASFEDLYRKFNSKRTCRYCETPLSEETFTVEHVMPLSKGGTKTIENLDFACKDCNHLKHDRTEGEFFLFLSEYVERFNSVL